MPSPRAGRVAMVLLALLGALPAAADDSPEVENVRPLGILAWNDSVLLLAELNPSFFKRIRRENVDRAQDWRTVTSRDELWRTIWSDDDATAFEVQHRTSRAAPWQTMSRVPSCR